MLPFVPNKSYVRKWVTARGGGVSWGLLTYHISEEA